MFQSADQISRSADQIIPKMPDQLIRKSVRSDKLIRSNQQFISDQSFSSGQFIQIWSGQISKNLPKVFSSSFFDFCISCLRLDSIDQAEVKIVCTPPVSSFSYLKLYSEKALKQYIFRGHIQQNIWKTFYGTEPKVISHASLISL